MSRPIVITGGGTGGHLYPMVAIAAALRESGCAQDEVRFVGSHRGQDAKILGDTHLRTTLLSGRGLQRSFRPRAVVDNIVAVIGLVWACKRAFWLIGAWRPRCVISVGGYASFPASLAAILWRRPLVQVDLDAVASASHRILLSRATVRCVASGDDRPGVIVTGVPVRHEIEEIDRSPAAVIAARANATPPISPSSRVIVVMTGSLGATRVNQAVAGLAREWENRRDITLVHITGRRDFEAIVRQRNSDGALDYRVEAFGDMTYWWSVADVAVCRAGAITVAELDAVGIPAVLVPLPGAPGDHQSANARVAAERGAALVVPDATCSPASLAEALTRLLEATPSREEYHGARVRQSAARRIAEAALGVAR